MRDQTSVLAQGNLTLVCCLLRPWLYHRKIDQVRCIFRMCCDCLLFVHTLSALLDNTCVWTKSLDFIIDFMASSDLRNATSHGHTPVTAGVSWLMWRLHYSAGMTSMYAEHAVVKSSAKLMWCACIPCLINEQLSTIPCQSCKNQLQYMDPKQPKQAQRAGGHAKCKLGLWCQQNRSKYLCT